MDLTNFCVCSKRMINLRHTFYFSFFCLMVANTSCNDRKPMTRTYEISRISFASGGCYGHCPFLAIEVDSSLHYKCYGGLFSDKPGYYTGKISQELWDSIYDKFEKVDFKKLDTSYEFSIDDLATQTIIFYSNKRKVIRAQSASLPHSVDSVLTWLMYTYRNVDVIRSNDSLHFFTVLQYPSAPPPFVFKYDTPRVDH